MTAFWFFSQPVKPHLFCYLYVVAEVEDPDPVEATTHKDSGVVTQALQPVGFTLPALLKPDRLKRVLLVSHSGAKLLFALLLRPPELSRLLTYALQNLSPRRVWH